MLEQFIEKNIGTLRKLRLLNIEINNILCSDLSGIRQLYFVRKEKLQKGKDELVSEIGKLNADIENENSKISDYNRKLSSSSSASEDDVEILNLKIQLAKKKSSEYEMKLKNLNKELEGYDKNIDSLCSIFKKYDSDKLDEDKDNSVIVELYKSVNYMKELLNNDVLIKYNQISEDFEKNSFKYPVAAVVNGFCENCNILVPTQTEIDILKMDDFIMCETCGCFLVDVIK